MNKVSILGTLTRDCEIKYTQSGTAVASFGIAHNEKKKQQDGNYTDVAHFFDVTAWGKTAENINQYFKKGSRILIDGRLDFSQWTSQSGEKRSKVGIIVEKFDFIDRKDNNIQPHQNATPPNTQSYSQPNTNTPPPHQNAPQAHPQQNVPVIDIDENSIPF